MDVYFAHEMLQDIKRYATERNMTTYDFVRRAVVSYIEKCKKNRNKENINHGVDKK